MSTRPIRQAHVKALASIQELPEKRKPTTTIEKSPPQKRSKVTSTIPKKSTIVCGAHKKCEAISTKHENAAAALMTSSKVTVDASSAVESLLEPLKGSSWYSTVSGIFKASETAKKLASSVMTAYSSLTPAIYPPLAQVFTALLECPSERVKVVILGQDPYHGEGQAHGLAFSVPRNVPCPPSVKTLYKELVEDPAVTNFTSAPTHGCLLGWAVQGVLLLNVALTVEASMPGSHMKWGWAEVTDAILRHLSNSHPHLVFMLWGKFAEKKESLLDGRKHLILKGAHPSTQSCGKFYGCRHFSKANDFLSTHGLGPIDWAAL